LKQTIKTRERSTLRSLADKECDQVAGGFEVSGFGYTFTYDCVGGTEIMALYKNSSPVWVRIS